MDNKSTRCSDNEPVRVDKDSHDVTGQKDGDVRARFKFKSKSSPEQNDLRRRHKRSPSTTSFRKDRHGHTKKQRKESKDNRKTPTPGPPVEERIDPDVAFRESLFDAMVDDEGAAFWEGVYGQPIPQVPPVKEGPTGELEAMTDEEYAAYVRAEMYKKTPQYFFEEKQRRDKAKKERAYLEERTREEKESAERFRRQVDESLRRGKARKDKAKRASEWSQKWQTYEASWEALASFTSTKIHWPVWKGVRDDITREHIEEFLLNGPTAGNPDLADLPRILKVERVRWHPDKVQQKLGGQGVVDEEKMKCVTAVFQIVDRIWTELRDKSV